MRPASTVQFQFAERKEKAKQRGLGTAFTVTRALNPAAQHHFVAWGKIQVRDKDLLLSNIPPCQSEPVAFCWVRVFF